MKEKLSTFVSSYNEIMNWIASGYEVEAKTADTTKSARARRDMTEEESLSDYLRGDATINDIKRSLQSVLSEFGRQQRNVADSQ